jgi:hypothetical protein
MSLENFSFNAEEVAPTGTYTPIPVGEYVATVVDLTPGDISTNGNQPLVLFLDVPGHNTVEHRFYVLRADGLAIKPGQAFLSAFLRAVAAGVPEAKRSAILHIQNANFAPVIGKSVKIKIEHEPGKPRLGDNGEALPPVMFAKITKFLPPAITAQVKAVPVEAPAPKAAAPVAKAKPIAKVPVEALAEAMAEAETTESEEDLEW